MKSKIYVVHDYGYLMAAFESEQEAEIYAKKKDGSVTELNFKRKSKK